MKDNDRDVAQRLGPSSPSQPALTSREAGPSCPVTMVPPVSAVTPAPGVAPPPPSSRKRPITLLELWPIHKGKTSRPLPHTDCGLPSPRDCRRKSTDTPEAQRPSKLSRPPPPRPHALVALDAPATPPSGHPSPLPSGPADVSFVGPAAPPALQAVSPSGDVRLTLRRYTAGDSLASPDILLRLDLRIHPRDLYAIPSDGHCGYHSLTVLTHPLYPLPPPPTERATLHRQLLLRLQDLADPDICAAATASLRHPPPRLLPRAHWFDAAWLNRIPDLPPIGCLALHDTADRSLSPWYYCTTISAAPTQLEHSMADLLRVADSGRLMLHSQSHFFPVTPPPFFSLALRQCSALLQPQLGGLPLPLTPTPPTPAGPPHVRRYTSTRALPGGIQLGLGKSDLSSEAQWGVFALKTIQQGACIMEYGGLLRSKTWLDSPGQCLTYVWSDLDNHQSLARTGQEPIILDANPAYTDGWGGRINDGFVLGANVEIRRDKNSPKAYVWALETITPGSELTVHYGPDYWQEHFFSCPDSVQQAAAQCYNLVVVNGKCFQTKELRKLRAQGQAHQLRGMWFLGPRSRPPSEGSSIPSRPRPSCNPLPLQACPPPSLALGSPFRQPPPPPGHPPRTWFTATFSSPNSSTLTQRHGTPNRRSG